MKLITVITAIFLLVALFLINTILLLGLLKFNPTFLISNHAYQHQHEQIIQYLFTGNDRKLKPLLPQDQFNHIKDVRALIAKIPITLFLVIAVSSYLAKQYQNIAIKEVVKYSIIILFALSLAGAILFMPLFTLFHQILFPQGNWAFDADSILIQLYPDQFWIIASTILAVGSFVELMIIKYWKNPSFTSQIHFMV
jgi:uncharacterized membrane protein